MARTLLRGTVRTVPLQALLALFALFVAILPGRAEAYPWMIRHGYTNCAQCHVDPSGGGVLTDYGRAQGEILVRTQYKKMTKEPGKEADFLLGLFPLPDALLLQGDVRGMVIPQPGNVRAILMQGDLRAAVVAGPFVATGTLGAVSEGGQGAWVTSNDAGWNLVAREYWAGIAPAKGWMIKAGRMNLPYGIRTENHILYTRSATRTTTNDEQQLGASVTYASKRFRAEVMGIAGNFQVRPDVFRERGYSLYATWAPEKTLELGVSSLLTVAGADVETLAPRTRQAHGVFTRYAPIDPLAILAEADLLLSDDDGTSTSGVVGNLVVDWEPKQGVHVMGIGGYCDASFADTSAPAYTGGGAVQWFLAPRVDIRMDIFQGVLYCTPGATARPMGLLQGHVYL
ncbi:MAG: hypothetical protein Q8P41_21505 [Pseudomonadota bacterium]|nr:hypothetical protein [Pseudomonadota bacterium]